MDNGYELPEKSGEPQVRLRVKHTRTAKDGWTLGESTVDLLIPLGEGAQAGSALLEGYVREVYRIGAREAARRNSEERGF
jgi:hypothetical protein